MHHNANMFSVVFHSIHSGMYNCCVVALVPDGQLFVLPLGTGDNMVPNFDLSSDFPSLGNRGGLQQSGGSQNARNYGY